MGSSEIVDSGKVAGQKSQFSQTCNLLSQFLKQKGSFGDLNNLGAIYRNFEPTGNQTTATTMNLLPMIEKSGDSAENDPQKPMNLFPQEVVFNKEQTSKKTTTDYAKSEPEKAQMTIFYGGQVIVFDDFPAAKANEIMKLANKQNPTNNYSYAMVNKQKSAPTLGNTLVQDLPMCQMPISQPTIVSDLPIARRNSLTRFLEKRKDRLTATAPYQICKEKVAAAAPSKQDENKAIWLGLGAQIPVKTEQYF